MSSSCFDNHYIGRYRRSSPYTPPSSPEVDEVSSTAEAGLTLREWDIISWMRANPSKPFYVDAESKISPLDGHERSVSRVHRSSYSSRTTDHRRRSGSRSGSDSEECERVDLTNEAPVPEHDQWSRSDSRSRYRSGISPGAFSSVAGSQRIIYKRDGDRPIIQNSTGSRHARRSSGYRSSNRSSDSRTMTMSGASVLHGASNFVISGSRIAPGAFSAIAGDQEIWVD
ncbi:hypothetical protein GYMLUDRAFT_43485 [Collybiopsis luxurians FD-317 M1]|uniref:Uncharacterized protein n=1 Tax=Collybiopsis luxurians FD-317 M1 TaxID=944289 RepID=A0A0D0BYP1_9AGAR|nr:hypothetical protein GYMLUDRAFT_43485 [Collybiopsis luxurians FD-317 M1]